MKRQFPVALLAACAVLFAGTFYLLLRGRFDTGNVYPPASSLRSDPLGTMIFYESLTALPGLKVERDHSAVNRLPKGQDTTYFQFGADFADWTSLPSETYRVVERFLLDGGRLVITFDPAYLRNKNRKEKPDEEETEKKSAEPEDAQKDEPSTEPEAPKKDPDKVTKRTGTEHFISLAEKWDLSLTRTPSSHDGKSTAKNAGAPGLPSQFPWHGDIILQDPGPEWTVLYRNEAGPVVAERKRGPGTIVIVTDSYLVSNEALVRDRQPALLAWLTGPNHHIVFDEAHHGIIDSPGIAALARKYRLFGGAAALLVLAALFIWKNSSGLSPVRSVTPASKDLIVGRNAAEGFIGLLKRNIAPDRILDVCLQEWRRSFAHGARFNAREKAALEEIVQAEAARPFRERKAAAAYENIRSALHRRHPQRSA